MIIVGTPFTKGAGYYKSDNRASGGELREADIRTCPHCQAIIKMQLWCVNGGFCARCNAPVCGPCAERALARGCEPFIAQLEAGVARADHLRTFRKFAGLDPPADPQALFMPDWR
jgi:predicted nucleic acid-binding Zn ribbon protein